LFTDIKAKAVAEIAGAVKTYIDERLRNHPADVTRMGVVTGVESGNKYLVKIQGADYSVPCVTGQTLSLNDVAVVLFAGNDYNRKFIIGKV
jgi:hypothetical protein